MQVNRKFSALFLDRDGVINVRPENDYVKNIAEFEFIEGVIESIASLTEYFNVIVVVTNQQGIGKGVMTHLDLEKIHSFMTDTIKHQGGMINKVYYCGDINDSGSLFRKPAIGMGLKAKKDFPGICFKKSFMVGDTFTDMLFGKRLRMKTVLVGADLMLAKKYPRLIDFRYNDLTEFTQSIKSNSHS